MKIIIFLLLMASVMTIGGSDEINEDCIVKKNGVKYLQTRNKIAWIAFLTKHIDLEMHVVYEEKDYLMDREELHFQKNAVYRVKIRNRQFMNKEVILSNISWPLGWTKFEAEIENTVMNITVSSYPLIIDFEFPVQYLSIISENMASCSKGKPIWKIEKSITSTIPLDGLENIQFSLSCNKPFSPILHIKEVKLNLQYHSGVKIGHGNSPLPGGNYDFIIEKETNKLILHSKQVDTGYVAIFEMAIANNLIYMMISSLDESFHLELTPKNFENLTEILSTSIPTTEFMFPSSNGGISLELSFVIFLAGMFIGVIINIAIRYIRKAKKNKYIKVDNETGYGRSSRNDNTKLANSCLQCDNNSKISTDSDQEQMHQVTQEDQSHFILTLDNCEDVQEENGKIFRKLKMSRNKENLLPGFQVCYFNKMIPKENKTTKVLLLVGEPEVGIPTLINAMVNHIYGVQFENKLKLRIACDFDHNHKTDILTAYCFPYQPQMIYQSDFVFIKTHHFPHTTESEQNKKVIQIKEFLDKNNGVNELHAICFVVKADNERVDILKNAYDSIFSSFGYDIKNNIFVLTTFDNLKGNVPKVVKALNEMQKHFNKCIRFSKDKKYLIQDMAKLFKLVDNISPCSLQLSNMMINERTRMEEIIENLREKITKGVDKMSELQKKESGALNPDTLKEIKTELKHMEELVINKIDETTRANKRLNELTLPNAPHAINDSIDILIKSENKSQKENYEDRIETLQKMKENKLYTKDILQDKALDGHTSIFKYFMDKPSHKKD